MGVWRRPESQKVGFLGLVGRLLTQSGASCVGVRPKLLAQSKKKDLWPKVLVETRGVDRIRESVDERRGRAGTL